MTYRTSVALVVLAGLVWSVQGLVIRQIGSTDTWAILFWRSAGTLPALVLAMALASRGRPFASLRRAGISGIVGGLALVFAFSGSIYSMQATTIANAVFLFSASPFFAALLGWIILRERVRPATWAAIALAMVGMFVMVREGLSAGALDGNIAALLSALGFAVFTVALRWHRAQDMLPAVFLGAVFSMVAAGGIQALRGADLALSAPDTAIAMALGAFVVGLGLALYTLGSKGIAAAELTLLSQIEVLMSPVWVLMFLNEAATAGTWLGGAILTLAVVFNGVWGASSSARAARRQDALRQAGAEP